MVDSNLCHFINTGIQICKFFVKPEVTQKDHSKRLCQELSFPHSRREAAFKNIPSTVFILTRFMEKISVADGHICFVIFPN